MINCIIGDFDSIRPEVRDFMKQQKVKMLRKDDEQTSDLSKCLYYSLEKISEYSGNFNSEKEFSSNKKKFSIILFNASGGRIDHTISTFNSVYQYMMNYSYVLTDTEVYLVSKSSMSVVLKEGNNVIFPSAFNEDKSEGYSLMALMNTPVNTTITEYVQGQIISEETQELKFGNSLYFKKKASATKIAITVDSSLGMVIYSVTTSFHNKLN